MRTYSLVRLPISQAAYSEIAAALKAADYGHCFLTTGGINMNGIAIEPDPNKAVPPGIVEIDAKDIDREAFRKIYHIENGTTDQ